MQQQGSIGRRLEATLVAFRNKDYETCLIHLFPALDKTAKRRRPSAKVGERICKFLEENEDLLSYIAMNGSVLRNVHVGDMSVPKAIYSYARCPIAHEGELDPRLQITEENKMMFGKEWIFPTSYIFALIIAVLIAPENSDEFLQENIILDFSNKSFSANEMWGCASSVRKEIGLTDMLAR